MQTTESDVIQAMPLNSNSRKGDFVRFSQNGKTYQGTIVADPEWVSIYNGEYFKIQTPTGIMRVLLV